jgi:hypothetical protein
MWSHTDRASWARGTHARGAVGMSSGDTAPLTDAERLNLLEASLQPSHALATDMVALHARLTGALKRAAKGTVAVVWMLLMMARVALPYPYGHTALHSDTGHRLAIDLPVTANI